MTRFTIVAVLVFVVTACAAEPDETPEETLHSIGACDTSATDSSCIEHGPGTDVGYSQGYCESTGGEWVASCPTANTVARCDWPNSVQYFYAGYSDLAGAQHQCSLYGSWHAQ